MAWLPRTSDEVPCTCIADRLTGRHQETTMTTDEAAPLPHQCGREALGHEPTVVPLRLSRESPVVAHGIAAMDDDRWVTIAASDGDHIKRWTHDPARLGAALADGCGEGEPLVQGILDV